MPSFTESCTRFHATSNRLMPATLMASCGHSCSGLPQSLMLGSLAWLTSLPTMRTRLLFHAPMPGMNVMRTRQSTTSIASQPSLIRNPQAWLFSTARPTKRT